MLNVCSGTETLQPPIRRTGLTSVDTSVMRLWEVDFARQAQDGEMLYKPELGQAAEERTGVTVCPWSGHLDTSAAENQEKGLRERLNSPGYAAFKMCGVGELSNSASTNSPKVLSGIKHLRGQAMQQTDVHNSHL
ncbi:hypothetical protein IHE44_0001886 [Lamprotornis superbus]|uniref:Uncharacterized protein n=1 Tax=Lamprotornis superbus TaxID=245042 RepID=A0A835TUX6_9PASS|nr:hypothetical protein IHE44_0001886 [Lamprotornis superbus]